MGLGCLVDTKRYLVDLVSDDDLDNVLGAVRVDLAEPLDQLVKGVALRDVIDYWSVTDHAATAPPLLTKNDTLGSTVVARCEGSEPLLPGGVLSRSAASVSITSRDSPRC